MFAKNNRETERNHNHSMLIFTPTTLSLISVSSSLSSSSTLPTIVGQVVGDEVVVQGGTSNISLHQNNQRCRHCSRRRQASIIINKSQMNNSMRFHVKNKVQH
jgi:hypothetical protein